MTKESNHAGADAIAATISAVRSARILLAKLHEIAARVETEQTHGALLAELRATALKTRRAMLDAQAAIDLALDEDDASKGA